MLTRVLCSLLVPLLLFLGIASTPATLRGDAARVDLAEHAEIRRDTFGVPHIFADSEEAAAFAHGYAAAEDHAQVLAQAYLRARGEEASIVGPSAVERDLLTRRLGIYRVSAERFATLPPTIQAILTGYAEGYNRFLSSHPDRAPKWARPITGVDVLAYCRAVLLQTFSMNLGPWREEQKERERLGSAMWAIGRSKSQSGRGLLLANPHLPWEMPYLMHEVQLTVPGVINVAGAAIVGTPLVMMGFNERLGWAHTFNHIEADDVYELQMDPAAEGHYLYDGRSLPLTSEPIVLSVKTDQGLVERRFQTWRSHFGPVIRIAGAKAYAFKSANLDLVEFATAYNQMAKAGTLGQFKAALQIQALPMFNLAYADREGSVYFLYNGRIPMRPSGFDWSKPVPGNSSLAEWFALYPLSALPQVENPPAGFVQNCNNAPWYTYPGTGLDPKQFPYIHPTPGLSLRAQRSLELLSGGEKMTLERVMALKYDEHLVLAERIKEPLLKELRRAATSDVQRATEQVIDQWDGSVASDSRGAILFADWWNEYTKRTKVAYRETWSAARALETPRGLGDPANAMNALLTVASADQQRYGKVDVAWGETHRFKRGAMNVPIGGLDDGGAFHVIWYHQERDGTYTASGGDSYALAVEFSDTPTARSVLAYSESSDPSSPHYNDQATLFTNRAYKPLWFSESDIAAHLERKYRPGR